MDRKRRPSRGQPLVEMALVVPALATRGWHGQAVPELALALPVLVFLFLGIADLGRAFFYREAVTNAARQALRLSVTQGQQGTGDTVCTNFSGTAQTTVGGSSGSPIDSTVQAAGLESSTTGSVSGSLISGATVTIVWHCDGSKKAITNATATSTDPSNSGSAAVQVSVGYAFQLITPLAGKLFGTQTPNIATTVSGRAEY